MEHAPARRELFEAVYEELRQIARSRMGRERPAHTLQPTALVHEAYLRLERSGFDPSDRQDLIAAASRTMLQLLTDHGRARMRLKRGGGNSGHRIDVGDDLLGPALESEEASQQLHSALEKLGRVDKRVASVVGCRDLAGMSTAETVERLGISEATVRRDRRFGLTFLREELSLE